MSKIGLTISVFSVSVFGCVFTPPVPTGETTSGAGGTLGFGGHQGTGGSLGQGGSTTTGFGGNSSSGSGGDVGMTGAAGGCGQSNVSIMAIPPDILIVQDKSGSMDNNDSDSSCKGGCGSMSKWSQVTAALNTVVSSTQSSINWGLKFFSDNKACGATAAPVVNVGPMSASAIASAISGTGPGGNTPTRDAITSGASYLSTLTDTNPKYLLLATDGLPNCPVGCASMTSNVSTSCTMTDNPSEDTAAENAIAAALQMGFKTYVIGIGNVTTAQNTLNAMAMAGGAPQTGAATSYYAATDPTALETALNAIVGAVASCNISLAGAPSGFTNVAVSADTTGGTVEIPQDPTNGWSYGPNNQSIVLNGTSCSSLKSGTYSNLQFYYACAGTTIHIGAVLPR